MGNETRRAAASVDRAFRRDPLGFMKAVHGRYGAVYSAPAFGATTVFCAPPATDELFDVEPDHLQVHNTPLVHELFGKAVFNLSGSDHARARRALNGGVGPRAVSDYAPALQNISERTVGAWADVGVADILAMARDLTLLCCERTMFGLIPQTSDALLLRTHLDRFAAGAQLSSEWRTARPSYWRARKSANVLRDLAEGVSRDGARANSAVHRIATAALTADDRSRLGDHALAILMAARETTASLVTWFIIEIGRDPALSGELRQEVLAFEGDPTGVLVDQHAPNLHAALLEVERRHAPNAISLRRATALCRIHDVDIEPGCLVAYSPSVNAIDDRRFPDSARFDATRFRSSGGTVCRPRDLLTFGRGHHACPGRRFAESVTLLLVAEALRHYDMRLASPCPIAVHHLPVKVPRQPVALNVSRTPL